MVDGKLGESLAVEGDASLLERRDELRVTDTLGTNSCIETNGPEVAERALLELSVTVGVLSGLDDGFLTLLHRRALHTTVTLREGAHGFDSTMPVNSTFDSHRGLDVRNEMCECTLVGRMHELRAVQALLALALLHEQVIAAVAVKRQLSAASATNTLFGAAV